MKTSVYAEGRAPDAPQITEFEKPTPPATKAPARKGAAGWLVPTGLILLVVIPLITGALRLSELAGGPQVMPANAAFVVTPLPVVVHIVGAAVFALLGAFQFGTGFRRRWPRWHRAAGQLLVVCGLLVGLSGLWMTLFLARPGGSHALLYAFRVVFGSGMVGSILLSYTAIRRGDVIGHRAWMMRAYAIGLGAGTQVLTGMAESLIVSQTSQLSTALAMGAAWVINLAVAEWAIRRKPAARAHATSAALSQVR